MSSCKVGGGYTEHVWDRLPLRVISGPFHFVSCHVLLNVQLVLRTVILVKL